MEISQRFEIGYSDNQIEKQIQKRDSEQRVYREKEECGEYRESFRLLLLGSALSLMSDPAFANRLQAAAERGKSEIIPMAQTAAVIGIIVGGFLMSIGAGHIGRGVLISALVGAAAIFGGPALIEVIRSIFGA